MKISIKSFLGTLLVAFFWTVVCGLVGFPVWGGEHMAGLLAFCFMWALSA